MTAVIDSYTYELLATPQFARIIDGTGADEGRGVVTDSDGNVYIAGSYSSTPTIKDQSGTSIGTLPASAGETVAFVSKFDSSGMYQYSRIVDGTGVDIGFSVTCDSSGNMYLAGSYIGTPTISAVNSSNVSTNIATLPASSGGRAAFASKFDSSGTYQYSRIVDGTGVDIVRNSVTCDSSGNMYLAGYYNGTPTIKAVNSSNVSTNIATLPASGGERVAFVSKLDSSGTYQYSRIVDASNDLGYSVSCDSSGNMYLAGTYAGTPTIRAVNSSNVSTNIATLPASSGGTSAAFASKFDSSGMYQYSRIVDGTGVDIGFSVTCDSSGNMYLAGYYNGTPTIRAVNSSNVSTNIATLPASAGGIVAFVCKFDSSGTYQYSRIVDSTSNDEGAGVTCDSSGNMYLAGYYNGTPTIKAVNSSNVSTNIATLPASGGGNVAFVSKFDSSGTYQYSRIVDSTGADIGYSVTCDSTGNMYLVGTYAGTPTIKDQSGTSLGTLPTSAGSSVAFLVKFDPDGNYAP
jgi:hypothetical protein